VLVLEIPFFLKTLSVAQAFNHMDFWLIGILLVLVFTQVLESLAILLNLRSLHQHPPQELAELYTPESYRKSLSYIRVTSNLALLQGVVSTTAVVIFILLEGFNAIDLYVRSMVHHDIGVGLLFIGTLLLLNFFLDLPFSLYKIFVIEERFGFNRTTTATYLTDLIKITLLLVCLGGPLAAFILWFFNNGGPFAWLYSWLAVSLFSLLLQVIAPLVILPLFNKLTPLQEGELAKAITVYAEQQSFAIQGIFTMDGSKRSTKANAFFTGFGPFKKVVFFDTLMQQLSTKEIVAVLAHEIGHYKLHHLPKKLGGSLFHGFAMFYLLSLFLHIEEISRAFSMEYVSIHAALVFFGLLFSPANMAISCIFQFFSRKHEYAADQFAATTLKSGGDLISALKKLSSTNFSHLTPHPLTIILHYSHPPLEARISRLHSHPTSSSQ
jgi:STE24 endopeptidase